MSLRSRLDRLETDLRATLQRLTGESIVTIRRERTLQERLAFCRVAERAQALRAAGVPCPLLPTDRDVIEDRDGARLIGGAVLASADDWPPYLSITTRVVELCKERGGPEIGAALVR